jgi:hypothetical protein
MAWVVLFLASPVMVAAVPALVLVRGARGSDAPTAYELVGWSS